MDNILKFKELPLSELIVNSSNDRHGPKSTEASAVDWLFEKHSAQMYALAKSIIEHGGISDPPLVKPTPDGYVVYDGNRRITCLKILTGYLSVPEKIQRKFDLLLEKKPWKTPSSLFCQIESEQEVIDQIVSRRHNGSDGGRGQVKWDPTAKANHAIRVGRKTSYPVAEAIEAFLTEEGVPFAKDVGRSTLDRLLKAKKRQEAVGFHVSKQGKLQLISPKEVVLPALVKIAEDVLDDTVTLDRLLKVSRIDTYLQELADQGFLPKKQTVDRSIAGTTTSQRPTTAQQVFSPPLARKKTRQTLIPKDIVYEISWRENQGKIRKIWDELRFTLKFGQHDISIAIVFRTLIELTTIQALHRMQCPEQKKLAANVRGCAQALKDLGLLSHQECADITRFGNSSHSNRELDALHRVVHSSTLTLGRDDLIAMWDVMESYILQAIEAPATDPRVGA